MDRVQPNICDDNYKGDRCGQCNDGHYRVNGKCQLCPAVNLLAQVVMWLLLGYIIHLGCE